MTGEDVLPEKGLLGKTATIKIFEYSPLGSKFKKQTDIAKVQYKLFKDQMNVGDGEIRDMHHDYIGNEFNDIINNIFTYRLKDKDLYLTNCDNQIGLKNIHFQKEKIQCFKTILILINPL